MATSGKCSDEFGRGMSLSHPSRPNATLPIAQPRRCGALWALSVIGAVVPLVGLATYLLTHSWEHRKGLAALTVLGLSYLVDALLHIESHFFLLCRKLLYKRTHCSRRGLLLGIVSSCKLLCIIALTVQTIRIDTNSDIHSWSNVLTSKEVDHGVADTIQTFDPTRIRVTGSSEAVNPLSCKPLSPYAAILDRV